MSYSIVARCPVSGRLGIGIASYTMAIGAYCDGAVRPNVGAALTQDVPLQRNNRLATNALSLGATPTIALRVLRENDPQFEFRQIAIVDREGNAAAHTGRNVPGIKGERVGAGFVVLGSGLASERVLDAMARPTVGHLDPRFGEMMEEMKELLRYAYQTENALTFPISAPGSVGMESCFVNLVEPGDKVIVCSNGVFGRRTVTRV